MKYFEYVEPKTVNEACQFLKQHQGAKILAGGASLVVLQKNNLIRPSHLVNLKTIPGLDKIEQGEEGLRIGALNRHRDILSSPMIQKFCPVLAEAASKIATPPIRNMGTIGGNVCHGEPSADFPPSLIALGAKLKLVSDEGERIVPIETFFVDHYETVLFANEILTEIAIPALSPRSSGSYITLDKTTNSIAIVGVAAVLSLDDNGTCTYAGVGLGGVAPTPLKVEKAKEILVGKKIKEAEIDRVAEEARAICNPLANVYASAEYRKEMVYVLTRRTLQEAVKRIGR
ncbi:MAG: xanthine dehydrogenase family protein subunit M [Syntrophorhabdales bacterium]|jgi:CO/xanthine dehydrogenase FAD-binding subunit